MLFDREYCHIESAIDLNRLPAGSEIVMVKRSNALRRRGGGGGGERVWRCCLIDESFMCTYILATYHIISGVVDMSG
jgi:hypothetical protein